MCPHIKEKFWFLPLIKGDSKVGLIQLELQPSPEHGGLRHVHSLTHSRRFTQGLVTAADQRGGIWPKYSVSFWLLWADTSNSESGMLSACTPLSVEKRHGYHTGRERGESNKEPAWVSKSLNSQLSETAWWPASVWEAGSDARHPHGFTALHPPVRCPAIKKWSVCITAPRRAIQPARFSPGVAMGVARRWYGSSWAYCK